MNSKYFVFIVKYARKAFISGSRFCRAAAFLFFGKQLQCVYKTSYSRELNFDMNALLLLMMSMTSPCGYI